MNTPEEQFEKQAKSAFDESVERLDAATLSKLNRSRQAALAEARSSRIRWQYWMPATGAAAAVLLAVMMLQPGQVPDAIEAPASDFEIMMSEESIDMIEELEFYSWLDTQDLAASGDVG